MNDEASKQLTDARFKRLVGVQRTTFEEMLAVLKTAYQLKHAKGGRKPKLSLEDLLMATLQYVREYRTYEQIAADFGVHESNLLRRSQWVEVTLVQSGVTISRTPLSSEDTVMIDAYGAGPFMVATKIKGMVAAEVSDERSAYMTRGHNNSRMITMGAQLVGDELAKNIAKGFVNGKYDGGRHQIRVDMLNKMG
ncbi:TPA: galactose-6-phosphate isomerase subunit LacA [Streptococcus pneumoniae]